MKKVKLLVVILTVALMLMGIGYAAWGDQINLTTTAKTGRLDVTLTHATIEDGTNKSTSSTYAYTEGIVHGLQSDSVGLYNNGDSMVVTLKNLYPGCQIRVNLYGENRSTMAVKPAGLEVKKISGNTDLFNALLCKCSFTVWPDGTSASEEGREIQGFLPLTQLPASFKDKVIDNANTYYPRSGAVLEPGGKFRFGPANEEDNCFIFSLPKELENKYMDKECKFEIRVNWEQFNEGDRY